MWKMSENVLTVEGESIPLSNRNGDISKFLEVKSWRVWPLFEYRKAVFFLAPFGNGSAYTERSQTLKASAIPV
jgi:hypothetical protein